MARLICGRHKWQGDNLRGQRPKTSSSPTPTRMHLWPWLQLETDAEEHVRLALRQNRSAGASRAWCEVPACRDHSSCSAPGQRAVQAAARETHIACQTPTAAGCACDVHSQRQSHGPGAWPARNQSAPARPSPPAPVSVRGDIALGGGSSAGSIFRADLCAHQAPARVPHTPFLPQTTTTRTIHPGLMAPAGMPTMVGEQLLPWL